jgi:hypothetical protein
MKLHEKCCRSMEYEKIEKGKSVFLAGNKEFYI